MLCVHVLVDNMCKYLVGCYVLVFWCDVICWRFVSCYVLSFGVMLFVFKSTFFDAPIDGSHVNEGKLSHVVSKYIVTEYKLHRIFVQGFQNRI